MDHPHLDALTQFSSGAKLAGAATAVVLTVLAPMGSIIWYQSQQDARVKAVEQTQTELSAKIDTQSEDNKRQRAEVNSKLDKLDDYRQEDERKLLHIEDMTTNMLDIVKRLDSFFRPSPPH